MLALYVVQENSINIAYLSNLVGMVSSLVVITGGVLAAWKLSYRVEPMVSGILVPADGTDLLIVTVRVKNIGLLDVGIYHDDSCIRIWKFDNGRQAEIQGSKRAVFIKDPPEEYKGGVSRNATLTEVKSFPLDGDDAQAPAYEVRFRVAVTGFRKHRRKPYVFNAATVVLRDSAHTTELTGTPQPL
jgi:hypothetical protein